MNTMIYYEMIYDIPVHMCGIIYVWMIYLSKKNKKQTMNK